VILQMENTMFNMIAAILQNGVMISIEEMLSLMDLFTTSSCLSSNVELLPSSTTPSAETDSTFLRSHSYFLPSSRYFTACT
ncbi:hypothetical protein GBAR_LOCUS11277, partial [Geodia barretti]